MANAAPVTKEEADAFLQDIRRRKGVDNLNIQPDDNTQCLINKLNTFSDELYTKPTHFLLELIQNADDNIYSNADPKLTLTTMFLSGSWQMRIDCNEDGFTKENVMAICMLGQSTKTCSGGTRGHIGEKGIGFKSVFKVADTVHISSGPWSFGFDKNHTLGMIAPILEEFPSELLSGQTQVLLDLRSESEARDVNNELAKITPEILIFLRKLKTIEIKTSTIHVIHRASSHFNDELGGEIITVKAEIFQGGNAYRVYETVYMIIRHHLTGISAHEKRPGISESDIVLAFPIVEDMGRQIPRYTYAYLPIADYGFNYLIHADFILLANRESIDYATDWNKSLQDGIVDVFQSAVSRFNAIPRTSAHSHLRYAWPKFLKRHHGPSAQFLNDLRDKIEDRLKNQRILELQNQPHILGLPPWFKFVPELYRYEGQLLFNNRTCPWWHLSFQYDLSPPAMQEELGYLGVTQMTFDDFFQQFSAFLTASGAQFLQTQSIQWHAQVSRILRENGSRSQVAQLSLIPLRDGRWVAASENSLFLNVEENNLDVPRGINICLVDVDASTNEDRRRLYTWLGIRSCKRPEVCLMIMELYSGTHLNRTSEDLVSDVLYLFNTASFGGKVDTLWLLGSDSLCHRSHAYLHIDIPGANFAISRFASNSESGIKLLHPTYLQAIDREDRKTVFVKWLLDRSTVSHLPYFVADGHITQIFDFFANNAVDELLLLLRDNWIHYSYSTIQGLHGQQDIYSLHQRVSGLSVRCTDGLYRSLNETVLPRPELQAVGRNLPFLDIPDPSNSRWHFLSAFRVLTAENLTLYLRQLKALAALDNPSGVERSAVREIYTQLGSRSQGHIDTMMLRSEFQNPPIFLPNEHQWVTLQECIWDAPSCLKSLHRLSNRYRDCSMLFRHILQLGDATIEHVVNELATLLPSATLSYQKNLLLELNKYIERGQPQSFVVRLRNKPVIPVRLGNDIKFITYDSSNWYLADRSNLRDSFGGRLWLIDFTVEEVRKISALVRAIGCETKLLSVAVEESNELSSDPILDQSRTREFRIRAQYLLHLIPDSIKQDPHLLGLLTTQIQELKVWSVVAIKVVRRVGVVSGRVDDDHVTFVDTDTTLNIYVAIGVQDVSVLMNCLSQRFIKHCGITDARYQTLVRPILDYAISGIRGFLEEQNVDGLESIDHNPVSNNTIDPPTPGGAQPTGVPVTGPAARVPTIESGVSNFWTAPPSDDSIVLQETIPALDQSISRVREAAATFTLAPVSLTESAGIQIQETQNSSNQGNEAGRSNNSRLTRSQARARDYDEAEESFQETRARSTFNSENLHSPLPVIPSNNFHLPNAQQMPAHSQIPRTRRTAFGNGAVLGNVNSAQLLDLRRKGILGESFIDTYLSRILPNWNYTCWTSKNRVESGHPPFAELERNFTDFTYRDTQIALARMLTTTGHMRAEEWMFNPERPITYHLEVKSTNGGCEKGFYMSNNQVEMARRYTLLNVSVPTDVYIIFRVYNLNQPGATNFQVHVDPWALYLIGRLRLEALDKYFVTPVIPRA